ncbi:hypothetical protein AHMF7616_00832 [Adhaeribacter pallidiroseus]|uniref:Four helix bundle protein n=2 Tax=Adhaeribacter pallidiroseus TaxID=2072847 RepID=A0A369QBE6_9BACT|nr:hypothetical protein AHMF7616_00832 [Adhaeribacter pallidiroseus]
MVSEIYEITKSFPREEMFGLTTQMRRAAVSVPSNIAESCGRQHINDAVQIFFIARGSLYELETQLYLALDLKYVSEQVAKETIQKITACKQLLHGFINYYKSLKISNNE